MRIRLLMARPALPSALRRWRMVPWPGQWHVFDQARQPAFACVSVGVGKSLHQSLIGHADHAGVYRVVAVIVAVLLAIQSQHIVQPEFGAQQRRHLARDDPGGAAGANQTQVLSSNA